MEELNNALQRAAAGRNMRFSNFLITISTNVVPQNAMERINLTRWLEAALQQEFYDFHRMDGNILKPAGAPNDQMVPLGYNHKVRTIQTMVTVETGARRGQLHAHVLLEICHNYVHANQYGLTGVHINRQGLQESLNRHIHTMPVPAARRPQSLYTNIRLLTRANDNTNKWLTLHYLNKDRDVAGRDLRADRAAADPTLEDAARSFETRAFGINTF